MTEALLHVVRHAEPAYGAGAAVEDPSAGLTLRGAEQARALGARLGAAGVDAVLHGPLARAARTAALLAAASGGPPVGATTLLDDRTPLPSDDAEVPDAYRRFVAAARADGGDEVDPDGEALDAAVAAFSAGQLGRTLAGCLGRPVPAPADRPLHVVLVTHAFVVGWFVRHALDAPAWRWMGLNASHASLTTLRVRAGAPTTLLGFDDLAHLPAALRSGVAVPRP